MAWIEERKNKKGEVTSYRISVSAGTDKNGKQIVKRKTWKPPQEGMTQRQIEKAVQQEATEFEESIKRGYELNFKMTFSDYADYVMSLKERTGVRPKTMERYREMLRRIIPEIGFMKIVDIRPKHLNQLYEKLAKEGIRLSEPKAKAKYNLKPLLKERSLSISEICRRTGISDKTISNVINEKAVLKTSAEYIANILKIPFNNLFEVTTNTKPLSNKTILEHHRLISSILNEAEKEMLIPYNPAGKASPPKYDRKEPDYFQPDEITEILNALDRAPIKWRAISYFLIDTGCRRGEAMGLKWSDLDLNAGSVKIQRALLYTKSKGIYEGPTKNKRIRVIKLIPITVEVLLEYKNYQDDIKAKSGDRWIDSGYVFTRDNGECMSPDSITQWLSKFSRKEGLPHIHPHAFRHTAASNMIANGVDIVTTASELGHANPATTSNFYAHLIAAAKARAAKARSSAFDQYLTNKNKKNT